MHAGKVIVLSLLLAGPGLAKPPRLVLFIGVDALSSDLFLRSRPGLKAGLAQLTSKGAVYPVAQYQFAETVTAVGHATLSTGANPNRHGVVSNRIFNRNTGKGEAIFADAAHPILEAPLSAEDVSPETLVAETLADRLRIATRERGKAVAISAKARSAIAMAGRLGQAWWFHESVGKFVTGTFYAKEFPAWVKAFNDKKLPDAQFGQEWTLARPAKEYRGEDDRPFESDQWGLGRAFPHPLNGGLVSPGPQFYAAFAATPSMYDYTVQFARAAIEGEQLGRDEVPDFLFIGISSTDYVYHLYGPSSWEMQDSISRLDRAIADLIAAAEKTAGRGNVLVVVSGDHGGAAIPEEWASAGMAAVRISPKTLETALQKELERFAPGLVLGIEETDVYLNARVIGEKRLDGPAVRRHAAQWLSRHPSVLMAVSRDELTGGDGGGGSGYMQALRAGYFPERSGDVLFIPRPFHVLTSSSTGTNHGTPYSYDAHVPVILYGKGIKAGNYLERIHPTDVAPTIAAVLEIDAPAMSEGRVLTEALTR